MQVSGGRNTGATKPSSMHLDHLISFSSFVQVHFGRNKIKMAGISTNILAKLGKGEFISMDSMQKICKALNCDVGDICVMNENSSAENK